jgi:GTP cyclohydrolase III
MKDYGADYMANNENVYIAIDGDSIGKLLEKYILCNDLEKLHNMSMNIQKDIDFIENIIKKMNGTVFMKGGDNILCLCESINLKTVIDAILSINKERDYHFSVGIAKSATSAYVSLKYAKLSGNTVVEINTNQNNNFEVVHS